MTKKKTNKRSKSSGRWLGEHFDDPYVQQAQREGYRSRAVYKLKQIDEKYRLLHQGMVVVDLGAAPGGWTQYVAQKVGSTGKIIASDILSMDALADVTFIEGDFTEDTVFDAIVAAVEGRPVDLVISDMAPNMSGIESVDIPRALYLVELAADFAFKVLCKNGCFLCKMFQGEGSDAFLNELRQAFKKVIVRKPDASRPRSREVYVYAEGFIKAPNMASK